MTYLEEAPGNFNPLDPRLHGDQFWPTMRALREECPVYESAGTNSVLISRYDDLMAVCKNPRLFRSESAVSPLPWEENVDVFKILPSEADGDYHREIRKLLTPLFTPSKIRVLEPTFRQIATELIDSFVERGSCEFVSEFAQILPGRAVYEGFLGAPREDFERVLGWVMSIVVRPGSSLDIQEQMVKWCKEIIASRRGAAPTDDLIDTVVHGEIAGRPLTTTERVQILTNTIIGAIDTTVSALSNIMFHLATQPELASELRAADLHGYQRAVEEFLRFEAPSPTLGRAATADTEIRGCPVSEGTHVLMYYSAANRDPDVFENPDSLVLDREGPTHLSFGWGPHICLGQHLARLELRVATEELLKRLDDIKLGHDVSEIHYEAGISRGPRTLPITFSAI